MKTNVLILWVMSGLIALATFGCFSAEKNSGDETAVSSTAEFEYGVHICACSGKLIETVRYGAVADTQNGKKYFNSVECLARWYLQNAGQISVNDIRVVDFIHGKALLKPDEAIYLNSKLRPSPGKLHLSALDRTNTKMHERVYEAYPGEFLEWDDMLAHVAGEWGLEGLPLSQN